MAPKQSIPSDYLAILEEFPEVQKVNFMEKPLHGVVHTINTGNHKPCKAKPRPLLAGTKKAIESKKTWFKLVELGVIEKVKKGSVADNVGHLLPGKINSQFGPGDHGLRDEYFDSHCRR